MIIWHPGMNREVGGVLSNTGKAVTTTVYEVGLIDSYKEVDANAVAARTR